MPRLKKSTKRRIEQVLALLLCSMMLIPIVTYFVTDPSVDVNQIVMKPENSELMETVPDDWKGPYEVLGVTDGDRIHIAMGDDIFRYIDLLGVEAPPVYDPETGKETDAGMDAYSYTRSLIEGHQVYLAYEDESSDQEETEALVYLDNGLLLNEQILRDGFAKVSSSLSDDIEKGLLEVQKEAKENGIGLWADHWSEEK